MAPVLTGRLILESLYSNGEQTTLAALATTLVADPAAVERLILSLSAAKLIRRTDDQLALTDAGRTWCASEFRVGRSTAAPPAEEAPTASTEAFERSAPMSLSRNMPLMAGKTNRMQGVQVVQVVHRKRRKDPLAGSMMPVESVAEPSPAIEPKPELEPEPEPKAALPGEPATDAPPAVPLTPEGLSEKPVRRKVAVDREGFVTHINGRKIF